MSGTGIDVQEWARADSAKRDAMQVEFLRKRADRLEAQAEAFLARARDCRRRIEEIGSRGFGKGME